MNRVHIVVDSIAQCPPELFAQHENLYKVPLRVALGAEEWREDEISTAELFRKEKETGLPIRTSQPAPGEWLQVLQPIVDAGDEAVIITVSSGLSGTVEGARSAAAMVDKKKIFVVDSKTASVGEAYLVEVALKLAAEGKSAAEIAAQLEARVAVTHSFMVPDTLEYLYKGGRIGGAAAVFGSILQIKPMIYLVDGKVDVFDKVRTKQRALKRMVDEVAKFKDLEYIGVGHIDVPEEGQAVLEEIRRIFPDTPLRSAGVGAVLGAHLGPGLIGIIFQERI